MLDSDLRERYPYKPNSALRFLAGEAGELAPGEPAACDDSCTGELKVSVSRVEVGDVAEEKLLAKEVAALATWVHTLSVAPALEARSCESVRAAGGGPSCPFPPRSAETSPVEGTNSGASVLNTKDESPVVL